jgi:hypothetical protein
VLRRTCPSGNADYLELRNVDWRSATDSSYFTTRVPAGSSHWQQISATAQDGRAVRPFTVDQRQHGLLVEFNRMDSPETFTYDERAHGSMPADQLRFDLADPNNWTW